MPAIGPVRRAVAVAAALLVGACERAPEPAKPGHLTREGRLGSLRDLVLFERPESGPAMALFVDRFEATRGDWAAFAATAAGRAVDAASVLHDGDPSLPIASIDVAQARVFAQWRFLRLPRSEELRFVTVGDPSNPFPWGRSPQPMRANTLELGLWRTTPVGTFESGRRALADSPYDLIGNVSEWTETVPSTFWRERLLSSGEARTTGALEPVRRLVECRQLGLDTPALAAWQGPGGLLPVAWLVSAGGAIVPREVVGADFLAKMEKSDLTEVVLSGDRRDRTGVRLCASAGELLRDLCQANAALTAAEELQARRFVQRGRHREVLSAAFRLLAPDEPALAADTPLGRLVRHELGVASDDRGR